MSKIIVRRQEYANNGTHANEIEAVVKQNLIANTLSSATDIAPSVGLLKSLVEPVNIDSLITKEADVTTLQFTAVQVGKVILIDWAFKANVAIPQFTTMLTLNNSFLNHYYAVNVMFDRTENAVRNLFYCNPDSLAVQITYGLTLDHTYMSSLVIVLK